MVTSLKHKNDKNTSLEQMPLNWDVPYQAIRILNTLESHGWSAWIVGGWVRDMVMRQLSHDIDIATAAPWQQSEQLFCDSGCSVFRTGCKHGTITVVLDHYAFEVTTYRSETTYSDHRHPDSVVFVDSIQKDLARRDFTCNALAYHPKRKLLDAYGGIDDIHAHILRCVGKADVRFEEDALRMLRALRFQATLHFELDSDIQIALDRHYLELLRIAPERIGSEIIKLSTSGLFFSSLRMHQKIFTVCIPEFKELYKCLGDRDFSQYSIAETAIARLMPVDERFITMVLLISEALPVQVLQDFYKRLERFNVPRAQSMRIIREHEVLHRLIKVCICCDSDTQNSDTQNSETQNYMVDVRRCSIRKELISDLHYLLLKKSPDPYSEMFHLLMFARIYCRTFMKVSTLACARIEELRYMLWCIKQQKVPLSCKELAINGCDVMELCNMGAGKGVACTLEHVLALVQEGRLVNSRCVLRAYLENLKTCKHTSS
ncbi:CCA tRNA nucleotidyltransferase [Fannyhessea vaginae]|uniref:CCA tRNA nucleotidyltransferase n=1 Tax=Fannyhessea vaginae TaxID=82135 RepID=UPI00288C1DF1|nr:CCA tRNA nucleotidyltransferase [Fannyhessea vaginae]